MRVLAPRTQGRRNARRSQDGTVAIVVAAATLALFGLAAIVVDFGTTYGEQRNLQNAADAASLAAGGVILQGSAPGDTCSTMVGRAAVVADAQDAARKALQENGGSGSSLVDDKVEIRCDDVRFPDRVVVSANAFKRSRSIFGSFFGANYYGLEKPAKSLIGPSAKLTGLRPFALCDVLDSIKDATPLAHISLDFDNADAGCGTASGNFGTLDFNHWSATPPAAPSGSCPGTAVVSPWVEFGFAGSIPTTSPIYVEGNPGMPSSSYESEFLAILDEPIVLPVFVDRTGTGCATSIYQVTGFAEVKVCGFQLSAGAPQRHTGACFDAASAPAGKMVQLQFQQFIPIGSLSLTCKLGDPTCDSGTPLLKLAD